MTSKEYRRMKTLNIDEINQAAAISAEKLERIVMRNVRHSEMSYSGYSFNDGTSMTEKFDDVVATIPEMVALNLK